MCPNFGGHASDPHYHCEWIDGFGGSNIDNFYRDNLPSGNYTVRVFDDGVCEFFKTISIFTPAPMTASLLAINDVVCKGDSTGSIVIDQVLGGTPPLRLSWSNGQNGYHPVNLKAGNYVLTVRDRNDCEIKEFYTITEPYDNIKFQSEVTSASCLQHNDGKIIVPSDNIFESPGINHFFLYQNGLLVGDFGADESFAYLASGDYSIIMENELGCRQTDSVSVGVINRDCIIIPDFISPNNDGYNDSWKLIGACDYDQMEVVIYNSFQEQVFTSQDCNFVFEPKSGSGQYYAYYLKLKEADQEYVIRGFFEVKY